MVPTVVRQKQQLVDHRRDEGVLEFVQTTARAVHDCNHRRVVHLALTQRSEDRAEVLVIPVGLDDPADAVRLGGT